MEHIHFFELSEELSRLYIIDDIPDIQTGIQEDEEEESNRGYLEDDDEKGDYNSRFSITLPVTYMGHEKKTRDEADSTCIEEPAEEHEMENFRLEDAGMVEYRETAFDAYSDTMLNENTLMDYKKDVLSIEYEKSELVGGQKTYQRLVFKADFDGESVYDLSLRKLQEAGIDVSTEYDGEFDSMIFTSVNNKYEGEDGNFNEFYLNGDIGRNAVDRELLKAGDLVEWRYAEETDGSCGGVPDYGQIKSLLEYNAVVKGGLPLSFNPNNMYAVAA